MLNQVKIFRQKELHLFTKMQYKTYLTSGIIITFLTGVFKPRQAVFKNRDIAGYHTPTKSFNRREAGR